MTELPKATVARLRTPSWRDTPLVAGVVLVLLSMVIGAKVVGPAGDTTPMYAAAASLVPGQPVTQGDVKRVDVQLGGGDHSSYVAADHDMEPGTTAVQVMVPEASVEGLIAAIDQEAKITLVPVPGSPVKAGA